MTLCKIKGCRNEAKTRCLCSHHYYKLRAYDDPNYQKEKKIKICKIKDCENKIIANSLCWKHYQRFRRNGETTIKIKHIEGCLVEGCENSYFAKNYCSDHYYSHYYKYKKRKV